MIFFDLCRLLVFLSEPIGNVADEIIVELIDSTWNLIKNSPLDFKSRNTTNTRLSCWNSPSLRGNILYKDCISWTQEILLGSHKEISFYRTHEGLDWRKSPKRQGIWQNIIFRLFVTTQTALYLCFLRAWNRSCIFVSGKKKKSKNWSNPQQHFQF